MRYAIILALLWLTGCAGPAPKPSAECTGIPGVGRYCLQQSTELAPFSVQQKVDLHFRNKHDTLIAQLENDASGMRFLGMTPFGMTLVQINFDNQEAQSVRSASKRLPPALLIGLLQIALWPQAAVQRGLGSEARVLDATGSRRIVVEGNTVLQVQHDDSPSPYQSLQIEVPDMELRLNIQTLPEPGSPKGRS